MALRNLQTDHRFDGVTLCDWRQLPMARLSAINAALGR